MKKRILIAVALIVAIFIVLSSCSAAQATTRHHHVKAKVCAKQYKHWGSTKFQQCKRQGWFYDRGTYPISTDPWTEAPYVLVYGPKGRLWVDTAGFYAVPNIR